jgi:hypothetical protein
MQHVKRPQGELTHCSSSAHQVSLDMAILMNLALAGLLLSLRDTQAKNIQAALNADIAGDVNQESLLVFETSQGSSTTLNVSHISPS